MSGFFVRWVVVTIARIIKSLHHMVSEKARLAVVRLGCMGCHLTDRASCSTWQTRKSTTLLYMFGRRNSSTGNTRIGADDAVYLSDDD